MKLTALIPISLLLAVGGTATYANVRLPAIFSDHMVVQADVAVPVWGWAAPDEEVTVSLADQSRTTKTGGNGKWLVKFTAFKASAQPQTLTAKGRNKVLVEDVLIGEVWLGSGQSNMEMSVARASNAAEEIAAAQFPAIRMFTVTTSYAQSAQEDCQGAWRVCHPTNVPLFSATAYFFGRELHKALGVPVGIIHSSVGGTPIEAWISPETQRNTPELKEYFVWQKEAAAGFNPVAAKAKYETNLAQWKVAAAKAKAEGKVPPKEPGDPVAWREREFNFGSLFNGKIAPLIPYAIRGVIWYQGESNSATRRAAFYRRQLTVLITDWRRRWDSELPFAWVQLPNFNGGASRNWPAIREAMLQTLTVPKTGMAITIDVGESKNLHPKNKQDIGRRLSWWALGTVYGRKVPAVSGPLPMGHQVNDREMVITFRHVDGGLNAKNGALNGFLIAGEDRQWKSAQARIAGDTVIVSSSEVQAPVAVRYAWANDPECGLFNGAGLPASPFRTDDWK